MTKRREFIKKSFLGTAGIAFSGRGLNANSAASANQSVESAYSPGSKIKNGIVTYLWGMNWDIPTLIRNCEEVGFEAVELRTQRAHGVETSLSNADRAEVKKRFADSPVICLGYGSNYSFHHPDHDVLRRDIQGTKDYIKLCYDIGATGIKVKPDALPEDVPTEKTIAQIAASLNEVGKFAQDFNQKIRVEVHGRGTSEPAVMKAIFDQVTEPNVKLCWNSNNADLMPPGLEANFNMLKKWFGDLVHTRALDTDQYPHQELFNLLAGIDYDGYLGLEAHSQPPDNLDAYREQVYLFKIKKIRAIRSLS
jgi:sugar phosphate isomerase/epimerase